MLSTSIPSAIQRGFLMVYGMFLPLIAGVPLVLFWFAQSFKLPDTFLILGVLLGIGAAWLWWSYRVPQWRLWALQHVDDIDALHHRAVQVGIEWPYGHVFERTEIKSRHHALQESVVQLRYYLNHTGRLLRQSLTDGHTDALCQSYSTCAEQIQKTLAVGEYVTPDALETLNNIVLQLARASRASNVNVELYDSLASTQYAARKYYRALPKILAGRKTA